MLSDTMDAAARNITRKGILFVIMGPAGSGKSTFCDRLVKEFPEALQYSTSVTSRPPRPNEVPGKSYHFISREEFISRREKGEFFEWEETHGNLYGTPQSSLIKGIESGKDLLFQIDIRGALNFKRQFPENAVTIFTVPPSFAELKQRLLARGTVDPAELKRRFSTAQEEYRTLLKLHGAIGQIDYLVVNRDLDSTYEQVRAIVVAERAKYHRMDKDSVEQFCEVGL
jgi:guanylate kinase